MSGLEDFTDEELALIDEAVLREGQLRNLQKVMSGSITPKKLKRMEKEVLPGYVTRNMNAQSKANTLMRKKGYTPKRSK